jgi:hypothetical protein
VTLADRDPTWSPSLAVCAPPTPSTPRTVPHRPPQLYAADARAQRPEQRVTRLLTDPHAAPPGWAPLADSLDPASPPTLLAHPGRAAHRRRPRRHRHHRAGPRRRRRPATAG